MQRAVLPAAPAPLVRRAAGARAQSGRHECAERQARMGGAALAPPISTEKRNAHSVRALWPALSVAPTLPLCTQPIITLVRGPALCSQLKA